MAAMAIVTSTLLVLAAMDRLRRRSSARLCLALALSASACSMILGRLPSLIGVPGSAQMAGGVQLSLAAGAASMIAAGAAGSAAFALARTLTRSPRLLRIPPVGAAVGVALCQVVLATSATTAAGPATGGVPGAAHAALEAFQVVTIAWPLFAVALVAHALRTFGPAVPNRSARTSIRGVLTGLLLLALAGAIRLVDLVAIGGANPEVAGMLAQIGLCVVAAGALAPSVLAVANPVVMRWQAVAFLHRISGLAAVLEALTPEWAPDHFSIGTLLRRPALVLYWQVILIRDATWSLSSEVDDPVLRDALDFAHLHRPHHSEREIAALAEACWISYAIRMRLRTAPRARAVGTGELLILERDSSDLLGLEYEELAFLTAVAQEWENQALLMEFAMWTEVRQADLLERRAS